MNTAPSQNATARRNTRNSSKKPVEVITLASGYVVSKYFFDKVWRQAEEVLPAVRRGEKYSAEDFCGEEFWGTDAVQQRLIGMCLAHAVDIELLPLEFVNRRKYPLKYRLK